MPTTPNRRRAGAVAVLAVGLLLTACGSQSSSTTSASTSASSATVTPSATALPSPVVAQPLVAHLPDLAADLHSAPVAIPLRFKAPTIGVDIAMEAVGLDTGNAMDAPGVGQEKATSADDPVWQAGFWYRGGAEPGQPGTATIAAHLDDIQGRPAAFWNLRKLQVGDVIEIDDQRSGAVIRFRVTEAHQYSISESSTRPVLTRLFGPEAALAQKPLFPGDGVARLSLVTCAGSFTRGEYDHRYMVFAERIDGPGSTTTPATPPAPTIDTSTGTATSG